MTQKKDDERHDTACTSGNRAGVPCNGVLKHVKCRVRYTIKISNDDQVHTLVTCNGRHEHDRPPLAGTQLAAGEQARLENVMNSNPGATPGELVRGRNLIPGASPEQGGPLSSISPVLASSARARHAIRSIRIENNGGGDASDEFQIAQFFIENPRNLLLSVNASLMNPIFLHIWCTVDFHDTILKMIDAYKRFAIGSTAAADMTFKHVRKGNIISLTCYDYILEREIPLAVAIVPDSKDTEVYFEYWSIIFEAVPELLEYNELDETWTLSLPGITVDFDPAQNAGFATAVGRFILKRNGEFPPSSLAEEEEIIAYNDKARDVGRAVALASLRPCEFHYNQAVIREGRKIHNIQDRGRFESKCMSLKRIDMTVEEFNETITDLTNSFPMQSTWLSYWTRTALARSIFPCLSNLELTLFLQRANTTSRTENIHDLYRQGSAGRDVPWAVFLRHLQLIDREFNERRQAIIQGEVNYQRSRPPTMERLPGRILSHGVLARVANTEQPREAVRGLPGRLSTHRSFRNLLLGIDDEFNGADDLGGLQRVEV